MPVEHSPRGGKDPDRQQSAGRSSSGEQQGKHQGASPASASVKAARRSSQGAAVTNEQTQAADHEGDLRQNPELRYTQTTRELTKSIEDTLTMLGKYERAEEIIAAMDNIRTAAINANKAGRSVMTKAESERRTAIRVRESLHMAQKELKEVQQAAKETNPENQGKKVESMQKTLQEQEGELKKLHEQLNDSRQEQARQALQLLDKEGEIKELRDATERLTAEKTDEVIVKYLVAEEAGMEDINDTGEATRHETIEVVHHALGTNITELLKGIERLAETHPVLRKHRDLTDWAEALSIKTQRLLRLNRTAAKRLAKAKEKETVTERNQGKEDSNVEELSLALGKAWSEVQDKNQEIERLTREIDMLQDRVRELEKTPEDKQVEQLSEKIAACDLESGVELTSLLEAEWPEAAYRNMRYAKGNLSKPTPNRLIITMEGNHLDDVVWKNMAKQFPTLEGRAETGCVMRATVTPAIEFIGRDGGIRTEKHVLIALRLPIDAKQEDIAQLINTAMKTAKKTMEEVTTEEGAGKAITTYVTTAWNERGIKKIMEVAARQHNIYPQVVGKKSPRRGGRTAHTTEQKKQTISVEKGNKTYAETLKELNDKIKPSEHNVEIRSVKETQRGQMIIEVLEKEEGATKVLAATLEREMTMKAKVEERREERFLVRNLWEGVSDKELEEGLRKTGLFTQRFRVEQPKKSKGPRNKNSVTAMIHVSPTDAWTLRKNGNTTVRLGEWTRVQITEWTVVPICDNCNKISHRKENCQEAKEEKKRCHQCAGFDHIASECVSLPQCYNCTEDREHSANTMECPVYRKALAQERGRLRTRSVSRRRGRSGSRERSRNRAWHAEKGRTRSTERQADQQQSTETMSTAGTAESARGRGRGERKGRGRNMMAEQPPPGFTMYQKTMMNADSRKRPPTSPGMEQQSSKGGRYDVPPEAIHISDSSEADIRLDVDEDADDLRGFPEEEEANDTEQK